MGEMLKDLNNAEKGKVKEFIDSFDTVFTDCDGVLWLENRVLRHSDECIKKFGELGKNIFYITNNSTRTKEEFLAKCEKLGFHAEWDNFINTSHLAASYLNDIKFDKKVYVIGSRGLTKELDRFGIKHTECGGLLEFEINKSPPWKPHPDVLDTNIQSYINKKLNLDPEIGAVLIGFDQHFSYPKILRAINYLKDPDCLFIATNSDENLTIDDLILPATGCMVRCIETAVGRQAYTIGKPNDFIKSVVERTCVVNPSRTLMIGDRCNTDILFGKRCGFQTLLVLSGVTSIEEVKKFASSPDPKDQDLVPHYYINTLGDLLKHMS